MKNKKQTINFISIFENHRATKHILDYWIIGESIGNCYENYEGDYEITLFVIECMYNLLDYQQDCDFEKMI
jgi:hypothetical protein